MAEIVTNEAEARKLRQGLHDKIDQLPVSKLPKVERLLLQIEVDQLRQELDSAFDQDRAESKLTPEKIGEAIALHRARHPYRG